MSFIILANIPEIRGGGQPVIGTDLIGRPATDEAAEVEPESKCEAGYLQLSCTTSRQLGLQRSEKFTFSII